MQVIALINIVTAQKLKFQRISLVIPDISPLLRDSCTNIKTSNKAI